MSVLICGMEMPNHCGECGVEWCERWKRLIVAGMPSAKARPEDCPLVPVPPHGRLIDADELKDVQQADADFFKGSSDYGEKCRYDEAINAVANIVNAPTIIPASEEAEDGS